MSDETCARCSHPKDEHGPPSLGLDSPTYDTVQREHGLPSALHLGSPLSAQQRARRAPGCQHSPCACPAFKEPTHG